MSLTTDLKDELARIQPATQHVAGVGVGLDGGVDAVEHAGPDQTLLGGVALLKY